MNWNVRSGFSAWPRTPHDFLSALQLPVDVFEFGMSAFPTDFFLVTNSTCTEYWFSDSVWLGIYPCDMEVLPLLTFSRTNIRLLLPHLPWLFPSWHPNWFTCPLANLSQARRPLLPPPRSPPFLQTNYRLLRRDFTLWHPGDLPILRLLRPPDKSLRIRSRSLPEKQTLRLQYVCVRVCDTAHTHTVCVCATSEQM